MAEKADKNEGQVLVKSSPWGNTSTPQACSLLDVMSEQLAWQINDEEKETTTEDLVDADPTLTCETIDTSSDEVLARMLQTQFDQEYNDELSAREKQANSHSHVKVSFDNYRYGHPSLEEEYEEEEVREQPPRKEPSVEFGKKGIAGKGKNIVTKHDAEICGRRNAMKIMDNLSLDLVTGDGDGMDLLLPNHVYNKLKTQRVTETKRAQRLTEKKQHSTAEHAVDDKTRLILFKLIDRCVLDNVTGVVSVGKEAVILHGLGVPGATVAVEGDQQQQLPVPEEVAIKVYKTTLSDFKNRADYVKGDPRFFKDEFKKQNPRKIMRLWAEKEKINLRRLRRFGIPCPSVIYHKRHVLIMNFIGDQQVAAPKIKDARLNATDYQLAYEQCVEGMTRMYRECLLIHGDLSEYNLLWWNQKLHFIDVSQSVDRTHPHAHEFLLRDCRNVSSFFQQKGVSGVLDSYELFNKVTGLNLKGEGHDFLMQVADYEKNEEKIRSGMSTKQDFPFDYFFSLQNATENLQLSESDSDDDEKTNNLKQTQQNKLETNEKETVVETSNH